MTYFRAATLLLASSLLTFTNMAIGACSELPIQLFGLPMGDLDGYPANLTPGIEREGSAEIIENVGFESLEGRSNGIEFDRIMVFVDRGTFIGFAAIGKVDASDDLGLTSVRTLVEKAVGQPMTSNGSNSFTFNCDASSHVTLSTTQWDDGNPRLLLKLENDIAVANMRAHIREYCADPKRRRPQDACK